MKKSTGFLVLAVLGICAGARAAPITESYDFLASGFGPGAPMDPVSGSFEVTFDPAVPVSGAPVDSISLDIAGQPYTTAGTAFGYNGLDLFLGGTLNGTAVLPGTNDFFLEGIVDAQGHFTGGLSFVYSTAGTGTTFAAGQVTVSTPIPEPPTWALAVAVLMLPGVRRLLIRAMRARRA